MERVKYRENKIEIRSRRGELKKIKNKEETT